MPVSPDLERHEEPRLLCRVSSSALVANVLLPDFTEILDSHGQGCGEPNGTFSLSGASCYRVLGPAFRPLRELGPTGLHDDPAVCEAAAA